MNQSTEVKDLFTALCNAQAKILGAVKDSTNPFFKSKYADLGSVWEACREALTTTGLSVSQTTEYHPEVGVCIITTLGHTSGQWIRGTLPIMAKTQDPQGIGSAITYARRYALAAIVGIVQVDDDGEDAMGRKNEKSPTSGVNPEQPPEGHFFEDDEYKPPFGQWKPYTLEELYKNVGPERMANYIDFLENSAIKKKQPLSEDVLEFIRRASAFLAAKEKQAAKDLGERQ